MKAGTKVRFTADNLGLIRDVHQYKFEEEHVGAGDWGVYEGKHPAIKGWHLIRVGELLCPCHESHFEAIE